MKIPMILTFWALEWLPNHSYFAMDIFYRLLLRVGIVVPSVFMCEVGSAVVECADFTCIVFTSLYSNNRRESAAADIKNGFSTKIWVGAHVGVGVIIHFMADNAM